MSVVMPSRPGNLLLTQPDEVYIAPSPISSVASEYVLTRDISPDRTENVAGPSTPRRPPSRTEKRYICDYEGCDKSYFKPSRLAEHKLTHTGERPHQCTYCDQSYLRSSHLHAHLRTHMSESDKPFECTYQGCAKRFWTNTHLKRHQAVHEQIPVYKCSESFTKAHMLRDHCVVAHMPPGSKGWKCDHEGCEATFALKQHLKTHQKTHDPNRYMCSHPDHEEFVHFSTWSALQSHLHTAHPPKCHYPECNGRTFKSAQRLKDHLKVHQDMQVDLETVVLDSEEVPDTLLDGLGLGSRKRRRKSEVVKEDRPIKLRRVESGQAGKEYECTEEGCEKRFKTKFALKSHEKAVHQGHKYPCPREHCDKAFAHRSSLKKHLDAHDLPPTPRRRRAREDEGVHAKDDFLGVKTPKARYTCPAHLMLSEDNNAASGCLERYNRVYDVRRHLASAHEIVMEDLEVRMLLAKAIQRKKEQEGGDEGLVAGYDERI